MTRPSLATLWVAAAFVAAAAPASGATTLVGHIGAKAGPQNARVWSILLSNTGASTAASARLTGFTLTQTSGAACSPVVTPPSSFPVVLGDIAPGTAIGTTFTVDFTGCPANASFALSIPFSADSGATAGTMARYHQYR